MKRSYLSRILVVTDGIRFFYSGAKNRDRTGPDRQPAGACHMPRYLIERTFCEELGTPDPSRTSGSRVLFIRNNTRLGVLWVQSFVSPGTRKSYCIYEAPNPGALRQAARLNGLPVDRIIEVRYLDPYQYLPEQEEQA